MLAAAALALSLAGAAGAVEPTPYKGGLPPVDKVQARVFRDKDEWQAFWSAAIAAPGHCPRAQKPPADAPAVDFERYQLIAAFMGQKSTTGHSIRIVAIEDQPKRRLVRAVTKSARGFVGMMLTCPADAVLAPKSALPVEFEVTASSAPRAAAPKP